MTKEREEHAQHEEERLTEEHAQAVQFACQLAIQHIGTRDIKGCAALVELGEFAAQFLPQQEVQSDGSS